MHMPSAWSLRIPGVSRNLSVDEVETIKSKGKNACFFVFGVGIIVGEIVLRKTADVVLDAGNAIHDAHTEYITKVRKNPTLLKSVAVVEPRTI
jgi:hypothetical protein